MIVLRKVFFILLGFVFCLVTNSCSHDEIDHLGTDNIDPKLLSVSFFTEDNPLQLIEDISSRVVGDSIVECLIRHIVSDKQLIPVFEYEGDDVAVDGQLYSSGDKVDFYSCPRTITVLSNGKSKDYSLCVKFFTGLPIIWIETDNREDIISKEEYLNATFRLEDNGTTRSFDIEANVMIKGRGTSSWDAPKKGYRLKFDNKVSLLNEPNDKSWVLIANYFDKTMIRNSISYYLGAISNLDYSPSFHFVELMLNGRYNGTYMLADKLKISKDRVNVGDDGFLVEIDAEVLYEGGTFFTTDSILSPISIKDPEVEVGDDNFVYLQQFFQSAEHTLFSDIFKDTNEGWQKYMDITSFVDWWLIHEITKNTDALSFGKSCYMNLKRGGKLKMGPIWDFDLSLGNNDVPIISSIEGFIYEDYNNKWYKRLFEDPVFVQKIKERYDYFYNEKDNILREINRESTYLQYSVIENDCRWKILNQFLPNKNRDVWGSYNNEVQYLKTWLNQRMDWLKMAIDQMN